VHSHKERRYRCHVCGRTFADTAGSVFYRRRLTRDTIVKVITLLADGCPRQAIVAAFEMDERTVKSLEESAGQHCQEVHAHLVEQPRDLAKCKPTRFAPKCRDISSGWLWRFRSKHDSGWGVSSVRPETRA
jgi:hypothetical protein